MAIRMLNIGGNPHDPNYRYRMPALQAKVEGRGNGIKTAVINMSDVAKALKRDPAYLTKYFGCELGAQSRYDAKSLVAVVNGAHDQVSRSRPAHPQQAVLQTMLQDFLDRFVLCPQCKLPEADLVITGRDDIELDCSACGHQGRVDMRHKLCTFIVNHPPGGKGGDAKKATKKDRKAAKKEKEAKKEEEEGVDFELTAEDMAALAMREDEEEEEEEEEDEEDELLREFARTIQAEGTTTDMMVAMAEKIQREEAIDDHTRGLYLMEALLWDVSDLATVVQQLNKAKPAFLKLCKTPHNHRYLLRALERVCYVRQPQLAEHFKSIVKYLYDQDVIEEEAILKWHETPGKSNKDRLLEKAIIKANRKSTQELIDWLKNAEEEESD